VIALAEPRRKFAGVRHAFICGKPRENGEWLDCLMYRYPPAPSVTAWLQAAGITSGRALRSITDTAKSARAFSDKAVALIVKSTVIAGEVANGASQVECWLGEPPEPGGE
jgi:hypothetical protein